MSRTDRGRARREVRRAATELARHVRDERQRRRPTYATVRKAKGEKVEAELVGHDLFLDGDDIVLGQTVRHYHKRRKIREGDTLVVTPMSNGDWTATDVLSDGAIPGGAAGVDVVAEYGFGEQDTPEDNAAAFVEALTENPGVPLYVKEGEYEVTAPHFDPLDTARTLRVVGDGPDATRFVIRAGTEPPYEGCHLFRVQGGFDYLGLQTRGSPSWEWGQPLTAAAELGDRTIFLADASGLAPGDYIQIRDEDLPIFNNYYNGAQHGVGSMNNRVYRVSGNEVTLMMPCEWAFTTTARVRKVDYAERPWFSDFSVRVEEGDLDRVGDALPRNIGIQCDQCYRPVVQNVEFVRPQRQMVKFQNTLFARVDNVVSRDGANRVNPLTVTNGGVSAAGDTIGTYVITANPGNLGLTVRNVVCDGGRHVVEVGGGGHDVVNRVILVDHCEAYNFTSAPFDTHTLAAFDVWYRSCLADGVTHNDFPSAAGAAVAGFKTRGQRTVFEDCVAKNCHTGFSVTAGALGTVISGGRAEDCVQGLESWATDTVKVLDGWRSVRSRRRGAYFTPRVAGAAKEGGSGIQKAQIDEVVIDSSVRIEGDPSESPLVFEYWDDSYRVSPQIIGTDKPAVNRRPVPALPVGADVATNTLRVPRA